MSIYFLQKLIREFNRNPKVRERFNERPEEVAAEYGLTLAERRAIEARDYCALYMMGVHGLLLRPFSILHQVPERDYLAAIRGEGEAR